MSQITIYIYPDKRSESGEIKESKSNYRCPDNTVITGRWHKGDENGKTRYEYSTLRAVDIHGKSVNGTITFENIRWEGWFKESSGSGFQASDNRVIIGREHKGDENGKTRYLTAEIFFNGEKASIESSYFSYQIKESSGSWFRTDRRRIITGRIHRGDENGNTTYKSGILMIANSSKEKAPEGTTLITEERLMSLPQKESNSYFLCPPNTVLTGRLHSGDENGDTRYQYAALQAVCNGEEVDGHITVENIKWTNDIKESDSRMVDAPFGKVLVGRKHNGNENGTTAYAIGEVFFNGHPTTTIDYQSSEPKKESDGILYFTEGGRVMTSRHHYGDENGMTYYGSALVSCDAPTISKEEVSVCVKMCSTENYFPMNPDDFIRLSRFRRHRSGTSDDGYSKTKGKFIDGSNSHDPEFYDIPVSIINSYYPKDEKRMLNNRPKDPNAVAPFVFLEPDDNLYGDSQPNQRVAAFKYKSGNIIQYWLFFGYNYATFGPISASHQGDWECITITLGKDNKISEVELSAHTGSNKYKANILGQLEITPIGNDQLLTVYCARGTHALFNHPGTYPHEVLGVTVNDYTDARGYSWNITDKIIDLNTVKWRDYAGAWGEVGVYKDDTTGPLGPWPKCGGRNVQIREEESPEPEELIDQNEILLIRNGKTETVKVANESDGTEALGTKNTVLYWRTHNGGASGSTSYTFGSLAAIDRDGTPVRGTVTIEDEKWSEWYKESESDEFFKSLSEGEGRVIIGRQHTGGADGNTRYKTGVVKFTFEGESVKHVAKILSYPSATLMIRENSGMTVLPKKNLIIIGITHSGDASGWSYYHQGYIAINKK